MLAMAAVLVNGYAPFTTHLATSSSARTAVHRQPAPLMIKPSGNSDPNFDPDNVDPDAVRRTVVRTGFVWVAVGVIAAAVWSNVDERASSWQQTCQWHRAAWATATALGA